MMVNEKKNDVSATAHQRKPRSVSPRAFFATFLIVGIAGLGLSSMYEYKGMQAVSVVAICIGLFYLNSKRA